MTSSHVFRLIIFLIAAIATGCATMSLEERMARKVGCDPKGVGVITRSHSPYHAVRIVTCRAEKEKYKCVEAPFTENCQPWDEKEDLKKQLAKRKKNKRR